MSKNVIKGLMLVALAVFVTGCASGNPSSGGITARAYFTDKDREDQDRSGGNKGYISGTPKEDAGPAKATRKVYVVEFTKELPEDNTEPLLPPRPPKPEPQVFQPPVYEEPEVVVRQVRPAVEVAPEACQEYVVQNGDTLQKISKKFFGTTKKWPKIYEANKDKLEDPDALKVGMRLCIPGAAAVVEPETENLK